MEKIVRLLVRLVLELTSRGERATGWELWFNFNSRQQDFKDTDTAVRNLSFGLSWDNWRAGGVTGC